MAIGPWGVAAIMGGVSGISSLIGSNAKQNAAAARQAGITYQNVLSQRKTQAMNAYRERAHKRKVERVREQMAENFIGANNAWQTEQARFNEQLLGFTFNKEALNQQLLQAQGYAAATEQYGRSSARAAAISTTGSYGRAAVKMDLSAASAARQNRRNLGKIAGDAYQADLTAYGSIVEGPIPEMAQSTYQAPGGGGLNTALTIANAAQSFIGTGLGFMKGIQ